MTRVIVLVAAFLVSGCAEHVYIGLGRPIGKQRAIEVAIAELRRRQIVLQPRWQITVEELKENYELRRERALYSVVFRDALVSAEYPRYIVAIEKYQGSVLYFLDVLRRPLSPSERSNQAMQPTATARLLYALAAMNATCHSRGG